MGCVMPLFLSIVFCSRSLNASQPNCKGQLALHIVIFQFIQMMIEKASGIILYPESRGPGSKPCLCLVVSYSLTNMHLLPMVLEAATESNGSVPM